MLASVLLLAISILAGVLGSLLGLGGGILIIPTLTLGFGVDIHYAIGASLVSVIATSSGAAAAYIRDQLTNVRLGIFLEVATSMGAVTGAFLSSKMHSRGLFLMFGILLFYSAYQMWKKKEAAALKSQSDSAPQNGWAKHLKLDSSYRDPQLGRTLFYRVENVPLGFMFMFGAGVLSALLGIGSGILKVLAMDTQMKLPIKVSTATSNFMIGVTAAASAGAYFIKGDIVPEIATPVALGVLIGALLGARLMVKLPALQMRRAFVIVLLIVGVQMILKGLHENPL